ncbi:MAG TPA: hypothetical protein VLB83_04180, partial [Candidatus Paceibacterota bacterium]|nr:hypothetical protein [Candidatus Paceibacterota bacterium]
GAPAPAPSGGAKFEDILVIFLAVVAILGIGGFVLKFTSAGDAALEALTRLHRFLTTISSLVSMAALVVFLYSFVRLREIRAEESQALGLVFNWKTERSIKSERWARVEEYMQSQNDSDWKIAVLEADNILDEAVERMGYPGETLGERMKVIEPSDFPYLDEAWEAHKIRNQVAHKGTNYTLTRSEAERAIGIYYRVFKSLGYL